MQNQFRLSRKLLSKSLSLLGIELNTYAKHAEKLVLDELRAIYVVIPKTGCTSIKKFFSNYYQWKEIGNVHNPSSEIYNHIINDDIQGEKYRDFFSFTFVRNPFSRLYSAFRSKVKPMGVNHPQWVDGVEIGLYDMGIRKDHSFKDFVNIVCKTPDQLCDPHVKPQWQFVVSSNRMWMINEVYKFENFEEDFMSILSKLKVDTGQNKIPHENRTQKHHQQYINYYDNRLIKMVIGKYRLDFDLFDYSTTI